MAGFATPITFNGAGEICSGVELIANKADGLQECGLVNPAGCLPQEVDDLFTDPTKIFPDGLDGVPKVASYKGRGRHEYIALHLVAQKRCGRSQRIVQSRDTGSFQEGWTPAAIPFSRSVRRFTYRLIMTTSRRGSACAPRNLPVRRLSRQLRSRLLRGE